MILSLKRSAPPPSAPQVQGNRNNNNQNKNDVEEEKVANVRNRELQTKHDEWLQEISKWYCIFKTKKCPKLAKGEKCPKGINCMDYHGKKDRRRVLSSGYKALACPKVYDYYDDQPSFRLDLDCPRSDECQYAHNYYELFYHPSSYKVKACPFYAVTRDHLEHKAERPFLRDRSWFEQMMTNNPIKKVKGNTITHVDGLHTCLDYCAFYHTEVDRRYKTDPLIEYKKRKRSSNVMDNSMDASISQCSSAPPHVNGPKVQIPVMQPQQMPQQQLIMLYLAVVGYPHVKSLEFNLCYEYDTMKWCGLSEENRFHCKCPDRGT
eukprot:168783_1